MELDKVEENLELESVDPIMFLVFLFFDHEDWKASIK